MPRTLKDCKEGYERINKKCLKSCASGSERGMNNRCKRVGTAATKRATTTTKMPTKKGCPPETHRLNKKGNCVIKCIDDVQILNVDTDRCNLIKTKKAAKPKPYDSENEPIGNLLQRITTQRKSRQTKKAKSLTPVRRSPTPLRRSPTPPSRDKSPTLRSDKDIPIKVYDDVRDHYIENGYDDDDKELLQIIKKELKLFDKNVLTKDDAITQFLTDSEVLELKPKEVYVMTTEQLFTYLGDNELDGEYNEDMDYFIYRKFKTGSVKKLLDRVKMIVMSQNAELDNYNTVKEAFQDLTNSYNMAITPGMAKYIDTYIKQKNRLKKKIDETGEHFEEEAPDYRDRDYYNGETYGLVVVEER